MFRRKLKARGRPKRTVRQLCSFNKSAADSRDRNENAPKHRLLPMVFERNANYTMWQKTTSLVRVNFFRQKVSLWSKKIFHLVSSAENIDFPPLNYDWKVKFWSFSAFWCSHSRAFASVQLALLGSSDPFLVRHGNPYGVPQGQYKNTRCSYGKIHSVRSRQYILFVQKNSVF